MANKNVTTDTEDMNFGAAISTDEVAELERHAQDSEMGVTRRLALLMMSSDRDAIAKIFQESPDTGLRTIQGLSGYYRHISAVQHLTRGAILRMLAAAEHVGEVDFSECSEEEVTEVLNEAFDIAYSDSAANDEAA